jgi:hypothetical protein
VMTRKKFSTCNWKQWVLSLRATRNNYCIAFIE